MELGTKTGLSILGQRFTRLGAQTGYSRQHDMQQTEKYEEDKDGQDGANAVEFVLGPQDVITAFGTDVHVKVRGA